MQIKEYYFMKLKFYCKCNYTPLQIVSTDVNSAKYGLVNKIHQYLLIANIKSVGRVFIQRENLLNKSIKVLDVVIL